MQSSLPSSSACSSPRPLPTLLHRGLPSIALWNSVPRSSPSRPKPCCSLATSSQKRSVEASWIPPEGIAPDGYGGWAVREREEDNRRDYLKFLLAGVGTSMVITLASFVYRSSWRKGFKLGIDAPFHNLHERLWPHQSVDAKSSAPKVDHVSEAQHDDKSDVVSNASNLDVNNVLGVQERRSTIVHIATDPTQQEALFVLKKLKIIENDVNPNELCTRREYARWLVKANFMLERRPRHRIIQLMPVADPVVAAFDDVNADDPDFLYIQALGEAGLVLSRLWPVTSSWLDDHSSTDAKGTFSFSPESFISRFDLVNWKTLLDYPFSFDMEEKMSTTRAGFLDLSATSSELSPQLLKDLMAGDKSITRTTFGNTRRLQPEKPATKAQAAVALASGRMAEAIRAEVSRLEAEKLSKLGEMEEIRSELIHKGEIPGYWEEKLNKEKERGLQVAMDLQSALRDLEIGKMALDEGLSNHIKAKAALDCQRQMLISLREEVDEMRDRLAGERACYASEKQSLEKLYMDLHENQEAVSERKFILEAEKEALQILRSWVEEEARRTQARTKVLEEATQRWKWNDGYGPTVTSLSETQASSREANRNGE